MRKRKWITILKRSADENVFADTNLLIDLLADRPPFSKFAAQIFDREEKKKVKLYTSSQSFATTHYLLKIYD
jgi:predicted nucleic-acid-binding protein